jgi:CARDB
MSIANIVFTELEVSPRVQIPAVHPDYLCANDVLVFNAACRNDGDRATRSFHVTFRLSNGAEHSERVEGLSPGEVQWVQWEHDALEAGYYEIFVEFDSRERIRESDENDNSLQRSFEIHWGQTNGHEVYIEGETIEVPDSTLEAAGWRRTDVNFLIRDAEGAPMTGYDFVTYFYGPDDQVTEGGDNELTSAGLLRCPDIWLMPEGSIRLTGYATPGGPHDGGPTLEGIHWYRLSEGATSLVLNVSQERKEIEVEASSAEEASEKVHAEGHAGLKLKVIEIGGGGGKEWTTTQSEGRTVRYKVILGEPELTITQG